MINSKMLGVVIVSYKNAERTADYINNQLKKLKQEYVVAVVNNDSTINECKELAKKCGGVVAEIGSVADKSNVYIIHNPENSGFAKGNNIGVRFLEKNCPCKYLLFSNDDILFDGEIDLQPMIKLLESNSSIGAIGPDVVGLDGQHQSPHNVKITAYRQILWYLFSNLRRKRKGKVSSSLVNSVSPEGKCYWVSGCFFIVRKNDFIDVEMFDPDTFLYAEEEILAEKLKKLGKYMYFYPSIKIKHLEGGTTKSNASSNKIKKWIVDSNCIYYKKYLATPTYIVNFYKCLAYRAIEKKNVSADRKN